MTVHWRSILKTEFLFTSKAFSPTAGELDEDNNFDFINPGLYALELADFLEKELSQHGYAKKSRCQEDWGHWLELEHTGNFTLAVCCVNTGDEIDGEPEHRVFTQPDRPVIRKFLKKSM